MLAELETERERHLAPIAVRIHRAWPAVVLATSLMAHAAWGGEKMGMTWAKGGHHNGLAIDAVSCSAGDRSCDPYVGDTVCSAALPLLCLKQDGSPRPNYAIHDSGGAMRDEFYRGWAGGHLATTLPVVGSSIGSSESADAACAAAFGTGWRMAEFHDGRYLPGMKHDRHYGSARYWNSASPWSAQDSRAGGWAFWAYGNVRDDTRFWVRIDDQRANCWD